MLYGWGCILDISEEHIVGPPIFATHHRQKLKGDSLLNELAKGLVRVEEVFLTGMNLIFLVKKT